MQKYATLIIGIFGFKWKTSKIEIYSIMYKNICWFQCYIYITIYLVSIYEATYKYEYEVFRNKKPKFCTKKISQEMFNQFLIRLHVIEKYVNQLTNTGV